MILEILKGVLHPKISEMMNAGDAVGRDPNEVGLEMVIERQEVWMKYYSESYVLLHKHFTAVFKDAMIRLVEEVLEVIIPELDGQAGFFLTEPIGKYLQGFHHFSLERKRGWRSPDERKRKRIESLRLNRPFKRFRRPKGTGWFRSASEFLVALKECIDASSGRPTEVWLVKKLSKHRYRQHPQKAKSEEGTLEGQRRTLRHWFRRARLNDLEGAIKWYQQIKEVERQQTASVVIKRKIGINPATGEEYPFVRSFTVSYRGVDPNTKEKEMFMRSTQKFFDPEETDFEVDATVAKQALLTGGFELVSIKTGPHERTGRIVGK